MAEDALPSGWQEVKDTEHDAGRYNPQPISRFEHTETGVGVRLTPADPNAVAENNDNEPEDEAKGDYQVTAGENGSGDPSEMTLIDNATDHAEALGLGREFMEAYNERCIEGDGNAASVLAEYSR